MLDHPCFRLKNLKSPRRSHHAAAQSAGGAKAGFRGI
jgi:hypothetical protein